MLRANPSSVGKQMGPHGAESCTNLAGYQDSACTPSTLAYICIIQLHLSFHYQITPMAAAATIKPLEADFEHGLFSAAYHAWK